MRRFAAMRARTGTLIYDHLALGVVETVQSAGILGKCAFPCNRHGKKKGIEAGIIEPLAEVASGRDYDTFLALGNCCEPRGAVAALLLALPTAQYDHMPRETLETLCNGLQVGGTFGYNERPASSARKRSSKIRSLRTSSSTIS